MSKARQMPLPSAAQQFIHTCRAHPASVNETYWQHMGFAMRMSFRLFRASAAALVHAILPAFCETTASREITAMHNKITQRHVDEGQNSAV